MHYKTITILDELREGDRFYFLSDKNRKVWQVMPRPQKEKKWLHAGKEFKADIEVKEDTGLKKWSQGKTNVVFLRHTINEQSGTELEKTVHA